jgi:hypothetical protein
MTAPCTFIMLESSFLIYPHRYFPNQDSESYGLGRERCEERMPKSPHHCSRLFEKYADKIYAVVRLGWQACRKIIL